MRKQARVKQMEAFFLNNLEAEPNLMIEEDKRGGGYIDGIFFILMGLACVIGRSRLLNKYEEAYQIITVLV
jgi:hypothetical protein